MPWRLSRWNDNNHILVESAFGRKCGMLCVCVCVVHVCMQDGRLMQGGNGDARGEVTIQTHCPVHQQHTMPVKTEIPAVLPSVTSLVWGSETSPPLPEPCEWRLLLQLGMPAEAVGSRQAGTFSSTWLTPSYMAPIWAFAMQTRNKACQGQTTKDRDRAEEWEERRTQEMEWETQGTAKTIMTSTNCVSYGQCECGDISVLCLSVKGWAN